MGPVLWAGGNHSVVCLRAQAFLKGHWSWETQAVRKCGSHQSSEERSGCKVWKMKASDKRIPAILARPLRMLCSAVLSGKRQ